MKSPLSLLGIAALTLLAACATGSTPGQIGSPGQPQRVSAPRGAQPRAVAFDNTYGLVTALKVYVRVDGGSEQTLTAGCNQKGCIVWVPLRNGPHTLALAVEQEGQRSEVTTVMVEAGAPDDLTTARS